MAREWQSHQTAPAASATRKYYLVLGCERTRRCLRFVALTVLVDAARDFSPLPSGLHTSSWGAVRPPNSPASSLGLIIPVTTSLCI
jgi:hypothetical protein